MKAQRQSAECDGAAGDKLPSKQINALALRCLCSSRVDIRPVDIRAAQEFRA